MSNTGDAVDRCNDEPQSSSPPTGVRWIALALVAFASASAYLTRYCISAANTTIQLELGFDDKQMGWILGAFALGYMFFQVPDGWLGNRFGTRFAFAFTSVFWSLCSVWSGLSSRLPVLWASRFGLGAFQAGLTPISAKILRDWIPLRNRGLASASIGACMSLGGAFALWLTGRLLEQGHDWRFIFQIYSVVGIAWAIGFYWFFRSHPEDHSGVNDAELQLIRRSDVATNQEDQPVNDEFDSEQPLAPDVAGPDADAPADIVMGMLRSPSMWALCVQSFFRAAGYAFFVTWFFAYLEYVYEIPKDEAGLLTSLPLLGVVVGSISGGFFVDVLLKRTRSKRISRSGTGLAALAICGVLTMSSAWTSSATQLATVMAIGAMFSGLANPAAWAATIDLGGRQTAVVMGVMNMAGCLAGFVLPIVLGNWFTSIKQTGGDWDLVIYLHAAFYFIAAACWFAIDPNRCLFPEKSGARG